MTGDGYDGRVLVVVLLRELPSYGAPGGGRRRDLHPPAADYLLGRLKECFFPDVAEEEGGEAPPHGGRRERAEGEEEAERGEEEEAPPPSSAGDCRPPPLGPREEVPFPLTTHEVRRCVRSGPRGGQAAAGGEVGRRRPPSGVVKF